MCITKVEAWSFDGKTYPTEALAIKAAVGKIVSNEALTNAVLQHAEELMPYLERIVEIRAGDADAPAEVTSEKAEPPYFDKRLAAIQGEFLEAKGAKASAVQDWLGSRNYSTMTAFLTSGPSGKRLAEVETLLGLRDDEE